MRITRKLPSDSHAKLQKTPIYLTQVGLNRCELSINRIEIQPSELFDFHFCHHLAINLY